MSTQPGSASPSPRSPRREQAISYADLMKPDEDWRTLANVADRRKIQNRLAQRAYRRSLRERNEEIKRLQQQVKRFEGTQVFAQVATPPTENDANFSSGVVSPGTAAQPDAPILSPADDWRSVYCYGATWPQIPESDQSTFIGPTYAVADAAFGFNSPGLDVTQEHVLLQPTSEPAEGDVANVNLSCLQQQGSTSGTDKTLTGSSPYNHHGILRSSCPGRGLPSGCCCKLNSDDAATSGFTTQRDGQSKPREVVIQPLNITSRQTQRQLPQGFIVERSNGREGLTIRFPPTVIDSRAKVVVFVIQGDEKVGTERDPDTYH